VQKAIAALAGTDIDDDAIGVMLLEDIRQIFLDAGSEKMFSDHLVKALYALEERPWSEWGRQREPMSQTQLAGLLSPFEIRSKDVRIGTEKLKGYTKDDFADAWERYLPSPLWPAPQNETPRQGNNDAGFRVSHAEAPSDTRSETPRQGNNEAPLSASPAETSRNGAHVADENALAPAPTNVCLGVSDRTQENVAEENQRTPAPKNACLGVSDQETGNGEGQQHTGLHAGDWCYLLSADGVQQNAEPYFCLTIERGPDGRQYARFMETDIGWPLAQCERTNPPAPVAPPNDVEDF
jgi:hypothetical protein